MRNRTLNDTRKQFLQDWANAVWRFSQDNTMFGKKTIRLQQIMAVAGPRAGALEIDAGLSAGDLMKKLRSDDHALNRQLIPWQFSGSPVVYMSRRYVRLEAGWPDGVGMTDVKLSEMGQHPKGDGRWIAGMNEYGATITLGFNDRVPHYLIGGYTGSGKTYAMRAAIAQLAQDTENQLVLIDGKYGDGLMILQHLPQVTGPVAVDIPHGRRALSWAVAEMRRRYESRQKPTRIIVVIDEIQEFTKDAVITEMIRILAAQGRGARVHLLIGTQHPKAAAFGDESAIKRNLPGRVALQTEDYIASQVVVGGSDPRADHLMGAGDAYAITPQAVHRTQLAYIPNHELEGNWSTSQPLLAEWPEFNPEAAGTLPLNEEAPKWSYIGEELAVGLVQAHLGNGRPATQSAFEAEGLDRPGSVRADRILKHRATHLDKHGELVIILLMEYFDPHSLLPNTRVLLYPFPNCK